VLPGVDVQGGPDRGRLGVAPGRGAQQRAGPQAVGHLKEVAGPHHDLEPFAQVRGGILETAGPHIQVRRQAQQACHFGHVAGVPALGQRRRAGALGAGQVPGSDQRRDQHGAAGAVNRGDAPGDLLLPPDQLDGAVIVAAAPRGDTERRQGQHLGGRVAEVPGVDAGSRQAESASIGRSPRSYVS